MGVSPTGGRGTKTGLLGGMGGGSPGFMLLNSDAEERSVVKGAVGHFMGSRDGGCVAVRSTPSKAHCLDQ